MELFINQEGQVDYEQAEANTTVQDLLDAIDRFLSVHPLSCPVCEHSCCKNPWSVEVDNVSVRRLCYADSGLIAEFVQHKLLKKKNHAWDIDQFVLKKDAACTFVTESNRCTIYEKRPVICRLYMCSPKSYRYNLLRELIGCTFLRALVLEDRMRQKPYSMRTIRRYKKNPAVFAIDYQVRLADVFDYAQDEGWLDRADRDLCRI